MDLIAHLASRLESARLLFVLALRPAELRLGRHPFLAIEPDLRARGVCREVALGFLGEPDIEDYLEVALPEHRLPEGFAGLLRAKTEGSPLFMVGLLDDLQARGVIAKEDGHWRLTRPLPAIEGELPQSVRGMIERRLGQLSASERLLVEAGGIQGFELDSATLARALKLDGEQVEEQLQGLERVHAFLDFVGEKELPNGALTSCYRFVHALYHDVLLDSLRPASRRALAAKVAAALRELHAGRVSPVVSQIALLLETARDFGPAADHYLLAAQQAAEVHACREAALLADKGLECARRLGEDPDRRGRLLLLQAVRDESVGDAHEMAGERAEARTLYASAREHAPAEDTLWQARLFRKTGRTWQLDHDYPAALDAHARAEATLEADTSLGPEKWREWIQVQLERMELHYFASQLRELDETCARSRPVVEAHGTPAQRSRFFVSLYLAGLRRDRYRPKDTTLAHARAGLLASRESGDLREEAWARFCLGFCHLWRSELSEAEEHLLGSLHACERIRDDTTRTRCLTYLTVLHRMRGDLDRAAEYAARSLEAATATAMKEYVGTACANEAWIAWRHGDRATARARGREALDIWSQLAPGHASAAFTWMGLLPLIGAALEMEDVEDAIACARKLAGDSTMELPGSVQDGTTRAIQAWEDGDRAAARRGLVAMIEAARANFLL